MNVEENLCQLYVDLLLKLLNKCLSQKSVCNEKSGKKLNEAIRTRSEFGGGMSWR